MDHSDQLAAWEALIASAEGAHASVDPQVAEDFYQQAIKHARLCFGESDIKLAHSWLYLGDFLEHQERYQEGETAYNNAITIYKECENPLLIAIAMRNLAQVVCAQGRHQEGIELRAYARRLFKRNYEA